MPTRRGLLAGISTFIVTAGAGARKVWARGQGADKLTAETFSAEPIFTAPNNERIVSVQKFGDDLVVVTERSGYWLRPKP